MALFPRETTELDTARSPSELDMAATAWGECQIRLLADRVASRRSGSTHKVYRGWRLAVVMIHGQPDPGTTLLTIPVDPGQLAASQARYALMQMPDQGLIDVGEAAAFSWSTTSSGTADPFATAVERAQHQLARDGWTQDATLPTCYARTEPTVRGRDAAA